MPATISGQTVSGRRRSWMLAAAALMIAGCTDHPAAAPRQPVAFPHDAHLAYFSSGRHRAEKIRMHTEIFGDPAVPPELAQGRCTECHDDLPARTACAGCHVLFQDAGLRERIDERRCIACHRGAWGTAAASLPATSVCVSCHGEERPFGSGPTSVLAVAAPGEGAAGARPPEDLPWVRVAAFPPSVYFSHRPHVQYAALACTRCHDDMRDLAAPPTALRLVSMAECLACHEKAGASTDCLTCHK